MPFGLFVCGVELNMWDIWQPIDSSEVVLRENEPGRGSLGSASSPQLSHAMSGRGAMRFGFCPPPCAPLPLMPGELLLGFQPGLSVPLISRSGCKVKKYETQSLDLDTCSQVSLYWSSEWVLSCGGV